ncbi:hypothetical protein TNCV_697431 [Trichonephila clavipes]|nr:hypothetical protein TNCV_697431 [Trichonephila clavipes]
MHTCQIHYQIWDGGSIADPYPCDVKERECILPNHFMSMISWAILGIIDKTKTAEAIIKDENLPLAKRYEILHKR